MRDMLFKVHAIVHSLEKALSMYMQNVVYEGVYECKVYEKS